jgi:SAM-dependent MidA family methyltransferase
MIEIEEILRQEIRERGPISFARFMEAALYCPKFGYYERDPGVIGFSGGFYTSASIGPLFGQVLAEQLAAWSMEFADDMAIDWIEAGAHDGTLARAVLEWLGKNRPALLDRLNYWISEPSPIRRTWQEQKLERFGRVKWLASVSELSEGAISGIIFSNELLDAFPVHRVEWDGSQWFEQGVTATGDRFIWKGLETATIDIETELNRAGFELQPELLAVLPPGFTIDLSPAVSAWWRNAATRLKSGRLLTIDYGFSADEMIVPERMHGTLRAYYRQRVSDDPLAHPGDQDITAHVNFSQIRRAGEETGLKTEIMTTQENFLTAVLRKRFEHQKDDEPDRFSPAELRQFHQLTHPEHMGLSFRVLVQRR